MFSGIVKGTGQVLEYVDVDSDRRLTIGFEGVDCLLYTSDAADE